jgi:hypothetical protein
MIIEGVDYAWDRPSAAGLAAAGKRFAIRYGGPGSAGKQLDAAELSALRAAGLDVVANAEGTADGLLGGWDVGRSWAREADQHFRSLGMPADRPIYLSVDFDVTDSQLKGRVADALLGARLELGANRVGVYGSYKVMQWARANGLAHWFWQTYAWSGGRWAAGNHLEQYRNGVALAGGTVDLTRATTADYGQWGYQPEDEVTQEEIAAGVGAFFWGAYHYVMRGTTDTFNKADAETQKVWRNSAIVLQKVLGGPVSEANIIGAVSQVDEAVWAKIPKDVTAAEKATLLRAVLGDDAAAVGALLQA